MYRLTREQLRRDLDQAFLDACKDKNDKPYVKDWRENIEENQQALCDDLWFHRYKTSLAVCLPVSYPKPREVFAFNFRDCIVHHLYYNYVLELLCRTFIQDAYSCIPGRGTAYGIHRLEKFIRSESLGYSVPCFALRIDVVGFFTNIRRSRLYEQTYGTIHKMADHRILSRVPTRWCDRIDIEFLDYLGAEIILRNPMENCQIIGSEKEWALVPPRKCLRNAPPDCGLPIGGLPSQMLQNVYMNPFDQWMCRVKKFKHGRYVDDSFQLSRSRDSLDALVPEIAAFLKDELMLDLHYGKTKIFDVYKGVPFLGAFILPGRTYVDNESLGRMKTKIDYLEENARNLNPDYLDSALNSYLGVLSNYSSYDLSCSLMKEEHDFSQYGIFSMDMRRFRSTGEVIVN
ncbi:MAG: hypothetical protein IJ686_01800 [Bacteroidales bacterium]|nr:hypothetical protein [Bacteroidales bacterium]